MALSKLPPPALYLPMMSGKYEVSPGLSRFGKDLGNGNCDDQVFQVDSDFADSRAAKVVARRDHFAHHVVSQGLDDRITARVVRFICERFATEHPAHVTLDISETTSTLRSALTNESIVVDGNGRLLDVQGPTRSEPPYADALDALASQVQEDLAIVTLSDGGHGLAAAHVCFPSGWAPEAMVGRDFAGLHHAVPGMEAMNARAGDFANLMVNASEGLVRFAWSITFDDRLDHHPAQPRAAFDPARPAAWLRVERQTIWGFAEVGAALFTIRTYLYDCAEICRDAVVRDRLVAALRSMSPASRVYKEIAGHVGQLIAYLTEQSRVFEQ